MKQRVGKMQSQWIPSPDLVIGGKRQRRKRTIIVTTYPRSCCRVGTKDLFDMQKILGQGILIKEMAIIPNKLIPKGRKIGQKANEKEDENKFFKR